MRIKLTIFYLLVFSQFSCERIPFGRSNFGLEYAKSELEYTLTNKTENHISIDTLIKDQATAVSISEAILFKIYGEDHIIEQRPYEIYKINGYWVIMGTLPKGWDGGTFLIILNSSNGQIIKMTHGK